MITILGPTASGKTQLAVELASKIDGEIISADSRQVYRGMDIGTGKDLAIYQINGEKIPYHLIDIVDAGESYNVHRFQQDFQVAYDDIISRNKTPILCGGTGLYIEAVLKNFQFTAVPIDLVLREELEQKSTEELTEIFNQNPSTYTPFADISTRKRLIRAIEIGKMVNGEWRMENGKLRIENGESKIYGLNPPLETRRERITRRLQERLKNGLIEEVESLLKGGVPAEKLIFYGLEYKFITQYLQGDFTLEIMTERLNIAIHQFAKRQMTYFRKMERDGLDIQWVTSIAELGLKKYKKD